MQFVRRPSLALEANYAICVSKHGLVRQSKIDIKVSVTWLKYRCKMRKNTYIVYFTVEKNENADLVDTIPKYNNV